MKDLERLIEINEGYRMLVGVPLSDTNINFNRVFNDRTVGGL